MPLLLTHDIIFGLVIHGNLLTHEEMVMFGVLLHISKCVIGETKEYVMMNTFPGS